jgi:hypothetical protein
MNLTIKIAAKIVTELHRTNKSSDTKKEGIYKSNIRRVLKEQTGKAK